MKPQRNRQKFIHAAPRRRSRGVVASAAFLTVAAAGGVLLSQVPGRAQPQDPSAVVRAGVTRNDVAYADSVAGVGGRASRSQARSAAPSDPASAVPAPASPSPQASAPVPVPTVTTAAPPAAQPSQKVLTYQFQLQPNYYYCGPASTRIVLSTTGHVLSQDEIARGLHTTTSGTDSADDATRFLNSIVAGSPYRTRAVPSMSAAVAMAGQVKADIVQAISAGHGVVANIVHSATDQNGVRHTYDGGHYIAVVGYKNDGSAVKIADPANPNGDGTYWVDTTVLAKWMATHGYSY